MADAKGQGLTWTHLIPANGVGGKCINALEQKISHGREEIEGLRESQKSRRSR